MVAVRVMIGPIAILLTWLAMSPYGRIYRKRLDAGE
jgi:hypothetical protein